MFENFPTPSRSFPQLSSSFHENLFTNSVASFLLSAAEQLVLILRPKNVANIQPNAFLIFWWLAELLQFKVGA